MIEFSANYYDGITSRARDVSVWVDEENALHLSGFDRPRVFPLGVVRFAPRVGSTLRAFVLPGGARCETADRRVVDELELRHGVTPGGALLRRLEGCTAALVLAQLLLVAALLGAIFAGIPLLSAQAVRAVPPAVAGELGRGTLAALDRTRFRPSALPLARQFEVMEGFYALARQCPELPLRLVFRSGTGPNALALPDGTVIVTDELVALAKDDRDLVAALAHEIGHVHHRHGLRLALESTSALVLAATYAADVTEVTSLSGVLPAVYAEARYSREHEAEADAFASERLSAMGVEPRHLANLLRALSRASLPDPEAEFAYLSTHPPLAERIQRLETAR